MAPGIIFAKALWVILSISTLLILENYLFNSFNHIQIGDLINSSPPGQNGHRFADNVFRCIFFNEKFCILIKISLK